MSPITLPSVKTTACQVARKYGRKPAVPHTRMHIHTHTHFTNSPHTGTALRSNRWSSFLLNHRRWGKPGELQAASTVRSQPEGSWWRVSLLPPETCCLLSTISPTTWCKLTLFLKLIWMVRSIKLQFLLIFHKCLLTLKGADAMSWYGIA